MQEQKMMLSFISQLCYCPPDDAFLLYNTEKTFSFHAHKNEKHFCLILSLSGGFCQRLMQDALFSKLVLHEL